MRLSTVLVTLVAVATTTASAEPTREEQGGRVSFVAPRPKPARADGWVELASAIPARHGVEFVVVGSNAGRFSQLRIQALGGKVLLRRIRIFYDLGTIQVVEIPRRLDQSRTSVVIDLPSTRPIDMLAIVTETTTTGTYGVYGSPGELGLVAR